MDNKRLTDLEVRVAYLEKSHDELSEMVRERYAQVAALRRMLQGSPKDPDAAAEPPRLLAGPSPFSGPRSPSMVCPWPT